MILVLVNKSCQSQGKNKEGFESNEKQPVSNVSAVVVALTPARRRFIATKSCPIKSNLVICGLGMLICSLYVSFMRQIKEMKSPLKRSSHHIVIKVSEVVKF